MHKCFKCGNTVEESRSGQRYCRECHKQYQRQNRPKHSQLNDTQRQKANARSYVNVYIRRGVLVKQPCEICGDSNAEKHHDDYSKPLEVKWLCRKHHVQHHKQISANG